MLKGNRVILRALSRDDLPRQRQHVWSDGAYDDLVVMGVLRPVEQTEAS